MSAISGRKLQFTAVNVRCASCVPSPRPSGATVICLCSVLMCCYISEQRWMQLIECDAAINCSCNRSVLESKRGTDRRRWTGKGCRRPHVFCPHSGNASIPTGAFPFVSCTCAHPTTPALVPRRPRSFSLHPLLLSLNGRLWPPPTSKWRLSICLAGSRCRIDWMMCLFLSRVMGIKCDISPQAAALLVWLCMKLRYRLAKLSFMVKLLSFRR